MGKANERKAGRRAGCEAAIGDGKRITLVIGSLSVGGSENQLALLAECLVRRGWTVRVFAFVAEGTLADRLRCAGVSILEAGSSVVGNRSFLSKLATLSGTELRLLGHCLRSRPSVLHAFLPLANFMAALAGRFAFVPVVVTSKRALGHHQDRHPGLKWMDRVANTLSNRVTANSQAVALDTERRDHCPRHKIAVIPNGLDFQRFAVADEQRQAIRARLGLADNEIGIVNVANLIPYKGHSELIEAFARLDCVHSGVRLFLVGEDRGIQAALTDRIDSLHVADKVQFLGLRDDVPELLGAMDVGVMASHEEGLSNALLEKLATGLPVVATNVGGNAEALDGMPNCRLVRAKDPEHLAQALLKLIETLPEPAQNRGMRRRLVRDRYSVDAMADAYERLYLESRGGSL
ncbi:MAG: glycosyltransferase [Stellaceae bacterium]